MTTFDTLSYAKKLRAAGFTEQQSEAQAEALRDVVSENLATKQDIENLRLEIRQLELRLTVRLGVMMGIAIGIVAALVKLL